MSLELQMPEDIDKKKYGFWRLETLPIIPEKFELKPIEKDQRIAIQSPKEADRAQRYRDSSSMPATLGARAS